MKSYNNKITLTFSLAKRTKKNLKANVSEHIHETNEPLTLLWRAKGARNSREDIEGK